MNRIAIIENGEKTILCFHIGRGGRYYNPGHLTFEGAKTITETSDFQNHLYPPKFKNGNDDLKTKKAEWLDCSGNSVELTNEMVKSGVGKINIDHAYDTTYTTYLEDLSKEEIGAIIDANPWDLKYINAVWLLVKMVEPKED